MVEVDPAYLAVLRGGHPDDARNFFAMGEHLARFNRAVIRAGATPVLVHHANRSLPGGEVMQLGHLSYGGFGQYAGQWMLLSRRSPTPGTAATTCG